ncbi:hypothetical protein THOG11_180092 [Vibrio harveyi]|nr:hypothetical protein TH15OA1_260075 [Vibrio harveyi]CAH1530713.1 hypothetical protein VHARVF571_250164 [Vibrio harveyi]CAH1558316.1 hypothetical protein THOD03_210092 [Vibrio harveyi]CAH1559961.1 hypothetical protein THOG11_180092 [Vibrio harveyi]CAK6715169.1 hypothetical protein HORM4_600066 [Vibrio harveyi]
MANVQEGTLPCSDGQNKGKQNGDLEHDSTIRLKINLGIYRRDPIN